MAVKVNLSSGSTEMVVGVVILIASTIKIIEELIVFIRYKASKLEVFRVAVAITKRVKKGVEIVKQQQ